MSPLTSRTERQRTAFLRFSKSFFPKTKLKDGIGLVRFLGTYLKQSAIILKHAWTGSILGVSTEILHSYSQLGHTPDHKRHLDNNFHFYPCASFFTSRLLSIIYWHGSRAEHTVKRRMPSLDKQPHQASPEKHLNHPTKGSPAQLLQQSHT